MERKQQNLAELARRNRSKSVDKHEVKVSVSKASKALDRIRVEVGKWRSGLHGEVVMFCALDCQRIKAPDAGD